MLAPFRWRGNTLSTTTQGDLHDGYTVSVNAFDLAAFLAEGQSWNSRSDPQEVTGVLFRLRNTAGSKAASMVRAHIHAHSGTFGTTSIPTGDPLVSSDFFELDTLTGAATEFFFPLSGWTPEVNTNYVAVIEFIDILGVGPGFGSRIELTHDSAGAHEGNLSQKSPIDSNWSSNQPADLYFQVYYQEGSLPPGAGGSREDGRLSSRSRMLTSIRVP